MVHVCVPVFLSMHEYVCVLQLRSHTDLLNFCNRISGGHCLVAGSKLQVTKVCICLLPHFLFRPPGRAGTEGGGNKGGVGGGRSGRGGGMGG